MLMDFLENFFKKEKNPHNLVWKYGELNKVGKVRNGEKPRLFPSLLPNICVFLNTFTMALNSELLRTALLRLFEMLHIYYLINYYKNPVRGVLVMISV